MIFIPYFSKIKKLVVRLIGNTETKLNCEQVRIEWGVGVLVRTKTIFVQCLVQISLGCLFCLDTQSLEVVIQTRFDRYLVLV